MATSAIFPGVSRRAGMYESFYLRAVSPDEPVGVWIRHTVHKRKGERARGAVWCTVFDSGRGRPYMHKLTSDALSVPAGGWIEVDGARFTPERADGACGAARWSLRFASSEPELRHLPSEWLYRAPLPRTKLTSPAPAARFDGSVEIAGRDTPIELQGWRGMFGHNWGAEHAERWIWLHGIGFDGAGDAWLDVALGRVRVAGRLTPWVANGALSLDGRRYRIGGLTARGLRVEETPTGCVLELSGEHGLRIKVHAVVPGESAAGWRYSDPDGKAHDVVNCSVAALELDVRPGGDAAVRVLRTAHGGVYELGMRERDHGCPIAPFNDA